MGKIKDWASELKKQLELIYKIYSYPKTPWYAKLATGIIIAYALSPIDLIPDFIPILGYLDDILLLPIGIYLSLKLVPKEIIEECKDIDIDYVRFKNKKAIAVIFIALFWILLLYFIINKIFF